MKRRYEVELSVSVLVEIEDEANSDAYEGETILTAHENRERFVEGSTFGTTIGSLAEALGINNQRMGNVDGWADFPENSAWAQIASVSVDSVYDEDGVLL